MLCIVSTAHFQTARLGSSGSSVCWRMCQRRWGMFQQRQRETPTTNMVCPPLLPPSMYVSCVCQFQKKGCRDIFILAFLSQICWSYLWHTQTIPLRSRFKAKTKWVSQAQFVKKNGALNLLQKNPESGSEIHSGGKICLPRFILLWNSSSARCLRNHRSMVY